ADAGSLVIAEVGIVLAAWTAFVMREPLRAFSARLLAGGGRERTWRAAARQLELGDVDAERIAGLVTALQGRLGVFVVRFEGRQARNEPSATFLSIQGHSGLTLRHRGMAAAMRAMAGWKAVELGDPEFDREVELSDPSDLALAVLDPETRG